MGLCRVLFCSVLFLNSDRTRHPAVGAVLYLGAPSKEPPCTVLVSCSTFLYLACFMDLTRLIQVTTVNTPQIALPILYFRRERSLQSLRIIEVLLRAQSVTARPVAVTETRPSLVHFVLVKNASQFLSPPQSILSAAPCCSRGQDGSLPHRNTLRVRLYPHSCPWGVSAVLP